jgi:hypothetical protein
MAGNNHRKIDKGAKCCGPFVPLSLLNAPKICLDSLDIK